MSADQQLPPLQVFSASPDADSARNEPPDSTTERDDALARGRTKRTAALALVAALTGPCASAQPVVAPDSATATATADMEARLGRSVEELERVLGERGVAGARAAELAREIETIRSDRAAITTTLIAAAKTERKLGLDIVALEGRLESLKAQASSLRTRLWDRRALLAEVLAALQRMGLNPPPAILVTPDDALASVRSAILLGAVVPEMRAETERLNADLAELGQLTASITEERARLETARAAQAEERARLTVLVEEKRALESGAAEALAEQERRAARLAGEARDLQALIMALEGDIQAARAAAERARLEAQEAERSAREARQEAQRVARESAERAARERLEAARQAEREARTRLEASRRRAEELAERQRRIAPSTPFDALTGQLEHPVAGRTITAFGDDDGLGSLARGDTLQTTPNAIVTAPADGWVLYAGPFRAYGNLLILDAGDGYHIVLAGMDRIEISRGQFVAGGEPVGIMGSIRLAGVTAAATENDSPTLYVEFRKNGKPVDPSPWWEAAGAGRT